MTVHFIILQLNMAEVSAAMSNLLQRQVQYDVCVMMNYRIAHEVHSVSC